MSYKNGKIWGSTIPLLVTPLIEVHKIDVKPQMQCSLHKHANKWNAFYVIDGSIEIHVQKRDYELTDVTILSAGDFTTVKPGEYHKFVTRVNPATVLEIYYLEPLSEDIIRQTVGGER
jgi:mannose-6-phosphate isomerase-like protein (cupin superfamily)